MTKIHKLARECFTNLLKYFEFLGPNNKDREAAGKLFFLSNLLNQKPTDQEIIDAFKNVGDFKNKALQTKCQEFVHQAQALQNLAYNDKRPFLGAYLPTDVLNIIFRSFDARLLINFLRVSKRAYLFVRRTFSHLFFDYSQLLSLSKTLAITQYLHCSSPYSDYVITRSDTDEKNLKVLNLRTGEYEWTLTHGGPVQNIAMTPSGDAALSTDGTICYLWDILTRTCLETQDGNLVLALSGIWKRLTANRKYLIFRMSNGNLFSYKINKKKNGDGIQLRSTCPTWQKFCISDKHLRFIYVDLNGYRITCKRLHDSREEHIQEELLTVEKVNNHFSDIFISCDREGNSLFLIVKDTSSVFDFNHYVRIKEYELKTKKCVKSLKLEMDSYTRCNIMCNIIDFFRTSDRKFFIGVLGSYPKGTTEHSAKIITWCTQTGKCVFKSELPSLFEDTSVSSRTIYLPKLFLLSDGQIAILLNRSKNEVDLLKFTFGEKPYPFDVNKVNSNTVTTKILEPNNFKNSGDFSTEIADFTILAGLAGLASVTLALTLLMLTSINFLLPLFLLILGASLMIGALITEIFSDSRIPPQGACESGQSPITFNNSPNETPQYNRDSYAKVLTKSTHADPPRKSVGTVLPCSPPSLH